MSRTSFFFVLMLIMLVAIPQNTPSSPAQANNGSVEGRVTLRGSSEGIAAVQVTLEGPISSSLNGLYTPNPALTPAMLTEIDTLIASARFGTALEQTADAVVRREAQLLGLAEPPRPQGAARRTLPPQIVSSSDNSGYFSFKALEAGRYRIRATREGHLAPPAPGIQGGSLSSEVTTTVKVIANSPAASVSLTFLRGSTITGTVRDPNANPAAGIGIRLYQVAYQETFATLQLLGSVRQTDDRGQYRLYDLPPGEYYVAIATSRAIGPARPQDGYALTFHPRAVELRNARKITLTAGTEIGSVDIDIQAKPSTTVSGRIQNIPLTGINGRPITGTTVFVAPVDPSEVRDNASIFSTSATSGGGASFDIRGLLPGDHYLISCVNDSSGRLMAARTAIHIGTGDVKDVAIDLQPAIDLRARLTVDGAAPPFTMGSPPPTNVDSIGDPSPPLQQALVPRPGITLRLRSLEPSATVPLECSSGAGSRLSNQVLFEASGLYTFQNVAAGQYAFQVAGLPPNAYVADIRRDDIVVDQGFDVGSASGNFTVSVNTKGSTVEGTVRDAEGKLFASARVALVPSEPQRRNTDRYKSAISDTSGRFEVTGLAPGNYTVFAWEAVPNNAWMNTEFLAPYESRGQHITVGSGSSVKVEVKLIR